MTQFTRATEVLAALEAYLLNAVPGRFEKCLLECEELSATLVKFDEKLVKGIFGASMGPRVASLKGRFAAFQTAFTPVRIENEERIKAEAAAAAAAAIAAAEAAAALAASAAAVDAATAPAPLAAPATSTSTSAPVVALLGGVKRPSAGDAAPKEAPAMKKSGVSTSAYETPRELSRSLSREVCADVCIKIASHLGINPNKELSSEQSRNILLALLQAKYKSPDSSSTPTSGWLHFATIEAEAALRLLDRDGSNTVSMEEFIDFATSNPLLFGPLMHVERLFRAYDSNADGDLSPDELYDLLYEVEREVTDEPPIQSVIEQRALFMLQNFDKDSSRSLSFTEFTTMVFSHTELFCTATSLHGYFVEADKDRNGVLDRAELTSMITKFIADSGLPVTRARAQQICDEVFEGADGDKDGEVTFSEFCAYLMRTPSKFDLFGLLCSFGKDASVHDIYRTSFLSQLGQLQGTQAPELDTCATCHSPLIGSFGIAKYGQSFCGATCQQGYDHAADARAQHLAKYYRQGFRRVTRGEELDAERLRREAMHKK